MFYVLVYVLTLESLTQLRGLATSPLPVPSLATPLAHIQTQIITELSIYKTCI